MNRGLFLCAPIVVLGAGIANAGTVDLINNQTGSANGALFWRSDFQSAGTGVIQPFVRISGNTDVVQGYNTSGRPVAFDENTSPTFTHDLLLSAVPIVNIGGTNYRQFILDINQTNADPFLSVHEIQIYQSNTGGQTTGNVASLGSLVYDLDSGADGDSLVDLDYGLNSGSGQGDMHMYILDSLFANLTFVYLYSAFGDPNNNNDGFEEWATLQAEQPPVVPLPTAVWPAMGCLAMAGGVAWKRRRNANA